MSEYKDTIITNQGLILADKASHGLASFQIKRATGSEKDLSSLSDDDVQNLTTIESDDKTGDLVDTGEEEETQVETIASFDNQNLAKGYYLRTIALWATDNRGNEILYSVTRAITPEYIPDFNKKNLLQFKINIQIIVGNRANVSIMLNPDSMATIGYANKIVEKAKSDLVGSLQSYYVDKQSNQDITGIKNFNNGLKVDNQDVYVQNDKLMYNDKPVLVANAPNAPKLELSVDKNTNDIQYKVLPPSISGGAEITGYNLYYKKSSDYQWQNKQLDKNDLVGQFPGEKSATYQAQVQAKNYAGDSVKSDIYSILSADIPKVTGFNFSYVDNSTASYEISANDNGANINLYRIYYKKQNDLNWTSFVGVYSKGNIILEYGANYNFKAVAQNAVGFSSEYISKYAHWDSRIFGIDFNGNKLNEYSNIDINTLDHWKTKSVQDGYGNQFLRFTKFYIYKDDSTSPYKLYVSQKKPNSSWYLPSCFYDYKNNQELPYVDISPYDYGAQYSENEGKLTLARTDSGSSGSHGSDYVISSLNKHLNKNDTGYMMFDFNTLDMIINYYRITQKMLLTSTPDPVVAIKNIVPSPSLSYLLIAGINISSPSLYWFALNNYNYKNGTFGYPYIKNTDGYQQSKWVLSSWGVVSTGFSSSFSSGSFSTNDNNNEFILMKKPYGLGG